MQQTPLQTAAAIGTALSTEIQCVLERVNNVDSIALMALNFAQLRGFVQAIIQQCAHLNPSFCRVFLTFILLALIFVGGPGAELK
jgi:hypothetical protein